MNPAEEIVKYWLQQNGYFFESSLKVGRKEVDLLATHPLHPDQNRHIEVSVSVNMVDPEHTPESKARHYLEHHFEHPDVKGLVKEKFGTDSYTRELVVGAVRLKGRDAVREFSDCCSQVGITVIPFSRVLKEVSSSLGSGTQLNCIVKTVQLVKAFS